MSRCVHIALCVCPCSTCSLISCPPTFSRVALHSTLLHALHCQDRCPRLASSRCCACGILSPQRTAVATGLPANKSVTTPIVNFCACFRVINLLTHPNPPTLITHPRPPTQLGRVRMGESVAVLFPPVGAKAHARRVSSCLPSETSLKTERGRRHCAPPHPTPTHRAQPPLQPSRIRPLPRCSCMHRSHVRVIAFAHDAHTCSLCRAACCRVVCAATVTHAAKSRHKSNHPQLFSAYGAYDDSWA
jgi:hypothetical protein